ncbi:MAG: cysteine desulfurase [Bacillaceae bacterium G1]|nr:cysteine desulfurase NifS [Bacillota bacterium]OJF17731.1 MAG: cysteine desulfurase [Bacillaceae bacterium G1]
MIYLDNSATTMPYPEVVQTVQDVMTRHFANPSSLHDLGEKAHRLLSEARLQAARILQVDAEEIVFTSSATESNNLAVKGAAFQYARRGKHIITTSVEHPSVEQPMAQLESAGFEVTRLSVDAHGHINLKELEQALRDDTILVSLIWVNNETGSVQPLAQVGQLLKRYRRVLFHVDAVQGFGKLPLDIKAWGIDLLSLSAHKFHGPRGAGLLYVRKGVMLTPLLAGGGQEGGVRSGTENLPAIVGMVQAMGKVEQQRHQQSARLRSLRERLQKGIEQIPEATVNSPPDGAPHILNVSFAGIKPEVLIHALEQKGVYVSTLSACSARRHQLSRVLLAMGLGEERASTSIRMSLSYANTEEEIEAAVRILQDTVGQLRKWVEV